MSDLELHHAAREHAAKRIADASGKAHVRLDGHNGVDAVFCKMCDVKIAGLVERDDIPEEIEVRNGKTFILKAYTFGYFSNYREVKLIHEDGGAHVTHLCATCLGRLTEDDYEFLYASDMAQWMEDEKLAPTSVLWHHFAYKKPIAHEAHNDFLRKDTG